jgi:hypothetical protein
MQKGAHPGTPSAMKYLSHKRVVEKYEGLRLGSDPGSAGAPDDGLIASELRLRMQISLDKMPRQRRTVFEMSRMERLSIPQIALKPGISESTVRAHLHNATRQLRKLTKYIQAFDIVDNHDAITNPDLKALAATLKEDSNPVIGIAKLKK